MAVECLRVFMLFTPAQPPLQAYTLSGRHQSLFPTYSLFVPLPYDLLRTFLSERACTPFRCCYEGCIQSNQQLSLSRLMHSIHRGGAVFLYQGLERTPTQGTNRLHGLHNRKFEGIRDRPCKKASAVCKNGER
jgi:hypothetical protein